MAQKVAILDDGINENLFNIGKLNNGIEITKELEIKKFEGCKGYLKSHGTICAAIIKKYSTDVELTSIKILNNHRCNKHQIAKAIEWCVNNDIKIVNLSLGTIYYEDFKLLERYIEYAREKGLIIVAAYNNNNIYTCPASFENVIGVKCDRIKALVEDEFFYNYKTSFFDGIEITASAQHALIDEKGDIYNTPICNSYAAPVITAHICKLMNEYSNMSAGEIQKCLEKAAVNKKCNNSLVDIANFNCDTVKEIDIPVVMLLDFTESNDFTIPELLCKYFKEKNFNAVAIVDNLLKSNKRSGVISLKEYYDNIKDRNISIFNQIYSTYNCDVLICSEDMTNKISNSDDKVNVDVKILIIKNFTDDIKKLIDNSIDSQIIIFTYSDILKQAIEKEYKVFNDVYKMYIYIVDLLTKE